MTLLTNYAPSSGDEKEDAPVEKPKDPSKELRARPNEGVKRSEEEHIEDTPLARTFKKKQNYVSKIRRKHCYGAYSF